MGFRNFFISVVEDVNAIYKQQFCLNNWRFSQRLSNTLVLNQNNLSGEVETFTSNPIYAIATPQVLLTTQNLLDKFLNPDIKLGISRSVSDPWEIIVSRYFAKLKQLYQVAFTC